MMLDSGADVSVFPLSCRAGQKTVYHTTISGFVGGKVRATVVVV